ncbi:MAG: PQQ-binding-like beta-propeller repeat protein [Planctomycetes bacterium]|nr:PQQ-binding-like beta-propeller repeat protein [Planctomycetota bacterium]
MDHGSTTAGPNGNSQSIDASARRVRWLPAAMILVISGLALAGVVFVFRSNPGFMNPALGAVGGLTFLALLIWMWSFSGLPRGTRTWSVGIPVGAIALFFVFFGVQGVSGDMIPELRPRRWVCWALSLDGPPRAALPKAERPVADLSKTTPDDYPQFLGPERRPEIHTLRLVRDRLSEPPREVWRRPVGAAWSSFAVVNGFAVTQEQHDEQEVVVCYELLTGKPLWSHANDGHFSATISGEGPRATPTIDSGRVYTQGAMGTLNCLDGGTGGLIWTRNTLEDTDAENMEWGVSCSPLMVDDMVLVGGGLMKEGGETRSLAAYDKHTGKLLWTAGNERSSYGSPLVTTFCGVRQIVTLNGATITGHDPQTGRTLWSFAWHNSQPSVTQPTPVSDDRFFISTGYDVGCALVQVARNDAGEFTVSEIWKNRELKTKFTNVAVRDGFVYGLDEGILACINLETGERAWKRGRYRHGQLILVDDILLITAESGEVVFVEATPNEHRELGRFQAVEGKTWNNPALYGRYLLVRNATEAACFELPIEENRSGAAPSTAARVELRKLQHPQVDELKKRSDIDLSQPLILGAVVDFLVADRPLGRQLQHVVRRHRPDRHLQPAEQVLPPPAAVQTQVVAADGRAPTAVADDRLVAEPRKVIGQPAKALLDML